MSERFEGTAALKDSPETAGGLIPDDENDELVEQQVENRTVKAGIVLPFPEPIIQESESEELAEDIPKYPDLSFEFNRTWLMGNGVVEAGFPSRVRAILYAVRDATKQHPETTDFEWPDMSALEKRHKMLQQYMQSVVSTGSDISVRRETLLPRNAVLQALHVQYERENHPLSQAFRALELQYAEHKDQLTGMRVVEDYLYLTVGFDEVKHIYSDAVRAEKKRLKEA